MNTLNKGALSELDTIKDTDWGDIDVEIRVPWSTSYAVVVSITIKDNQHYVLGSSSCVTGTRGVAAFAEAWARLSMFIADNGLTPDPSR